MDSVLQCVAAAMLVEDPTAMDGHMKFLALPFLHLKVMETMLLSVHHI